MWWSRAVLILVLPLALGACGFRPLYGQAGVTAAVQGDLAAIAIEAPSQRLSQRLRHILVANLTPRGEPAIARYRLTVALDEAQEGEGLRSDLTFTRITYTLKGAYQLIDNASGQVLASGTARSFTAYNVGASQVATVTSETDARERAAQSLADDLRLKLAVYFESRKARP